MTFDIFSNLGNFFKKGIIYGVIFSLSFPHFAWATEAIIELDFKDSQTPQRLHVIPRLSNVADVSHVEIDTEQQQVVVHRLRKPEDDLAEQSAAVVSLLTSPVMIQKHDVQNLPWELEPEQLSLFILNHNAWLSPLGEDGYKLEFKGGLLGGMKPWQQPDFIKGGWKEKDFWWDPQAKQYIPQVTVYPKILYPQTVMGGGGFGNSNGSSIGFIKEPSFQERCDFMKKSHERRRLAEKKKEDQERQRQFQERLKFSPSVIVKPYYKRPVDNIPVHNPLAGIKPQPSKKEPFQTGSSLEAQYSRLRVLYNMADSWEWREIYQYAKVISVSRDEIAKYNLIQRHSNGQTFSLKYFKELKEEEARNELKKREQEEEKREKARQYEEESSRAASSLFDNVPPPQYQVTPEYFTQSASDAGMNPSQALNIILNPTSENFYDRIILTSRQNWLGGAKNTTAFGFEDLTNEQAYKYISQGYKPWDFPTLSNRLVCQKGSSLFKDVTSEYFSKQAEKAKMTSMQALSILMNPTSENFYDRIILTSRQNWLGGAQNTTSFWFEDLTNEQAYQYISQGYKSQDFPTLSNRLISQRGATLFENVTPDYFVKQAEKTGMTPMKSLAILMNPTLENAYERVLLASRQNYLGGNHDLFVFRDIGITVGEAYDHLLTHIKNKESFSQLLDDSTNKIIKDGFTQFCLERYHTLYGSFYGEYEKVKHLQYLINTTTWEATYNYADKEGFSKEDVQYVDSRKKENITFDSYMKEVFDDQVLEEWGAKDWREVFRSTGDDAEFIQVNVIKKVYDAYKLGAQYGPKGLKLLREGWQKAVQAYKGEIVKGLKIDKKTLDKIPKELGDAKISRDTKGLRWGDDNNGIRIMKGEPNAPYQHQRVDYVRITSKGKVVDKKGVEIPGKELGVKTKENPDVHVPLSEWQNWKQWNKP